MKIGITPLISQNIAPKNATKIAVYDTNGKQVATVPLGRLTHPTKQKLYSFGLISDIHIWKSAPTWNGNAKFDKALTYFENNDCAFCVHCGDITQTGLYDEGNKTTLVPTQFENYKAICDVHPIIVYGICGNHESYVVPIINNLPELKYYTGTDLYYTVEQGDDLFILIGQPSYKEVMGDDALEWLQKTLDENQNRRCFVFIHPYIEEDSGDPLDFRENSVFDDWGAIKTNAFMNIMRQYKNAILFHGHSHTKYEWQKYDENANYTERNGFKSVHVSSSGKPRNIDPVTGETPEDNNGSQGYIVDVYEDCIVLNGIEFTEEKWIPLGTYKIMT